MSVSPWPEVTHVHGGGGGRDEIKRFSRQSRRRLQKRVACLERGKVERCIFLTLTYGDYSDDPREWKRDLANFRRVLVDAYPFCSAIWRLEAQKRGAPHFHLLVFGVGFIPKEWVDAHWGRGFCRTERPHDYPSAVQYVAKYVAKESDDEGFRTMAGVPIGKVGRHWGVMNGPCLPLADIAYYHVGSIVERDRIIDELCGWAGVDFERWWPLHAKAEFFGYDPPPGLLMDE